MSERSAAIRLKRRGRFLRFMFWLIAIGAIAAVILLWKCGGGFGLGLGGKGGLGLGGGKGTGIGSGEGKASGAAQGLAGEVPKRCQIRVDGAGLSLDGKPAAIPAMIEACKTTPGADVLVAGDARQGTWDELRAALDAAGIPSLVRGAVAPPPAPTDAAPAAVSPVDAAAAAPEAPEAPAVPPAVDGGV